MIKRKATLHLICGLPGSGKSTLALELETKYAALRLTPDEWIIQMGASGDDEKLRTSIENLQWSIAQRTLSLGLDVILEFGFWSKIERTMFRRKATSIGATTKLYYLDISKDELKRRISIRNQSQDTSSFYIDPEKIDEWSATFEAPSKEELQDLS
jgi:predicted kinase